MLNSFGLRVLQNIVDESLGTIDETLELIVTEENKQNFQKYEFPINELDRVGFISLNRYSSLKGEIWEIKVTLEGYEYLKSRVG